MKSNFNETTKKVSNKVMIFLDFAPHTCVLRKVVLPWPPSTPPLLAPCQPSQPWWVERGGARETLKTCETIKEKKSAQFTHYVSHGGVRF